MPNTRFTTTLGELFETLPGAGRFHPDFTAAVIELPPGVTSGWRRSGEQWLPPEEDVENHGGVPERVEELERAVNAMLGGENE